MTTFNRDGKRMALLLGASEAATGLSREEAQDYDLYDAFKDFAMAAGPNAVFRNIRGAASEIGLFKPDEALEGVEKARKEKIGLANLDALDAAISNYHIRSKTPTTRYRTQKSRGLSR